MSYILRKSTRSRGLYLQIIESYWNSEKGKSAQRSFRTLGYVCDMLDSGISDPVAHAQAEVDALNADMRREADEAKSRKIGDSPIRYCGYFVLKQLMNQLGICPYLRLLGETRRFQFAFDTLIEGLIYARVVKPCSKHRTWEEIFPLLFESKYDFSYNQVLTALDFAGQEYERIAEIFTHQIALIYGIDSSKSYMDCTNYYFEIDREDKFRRKGPSKENRHDPIVGMGLLLDANLIPIGMKMYPGNASEKPILRNMIDSLKQRSNIRGKTIQVADKGLNCAENIYHAVAAGDGYIFSKSVKMLSQKEQRWVFLDQDWQNVTKDGKILYRVKTCIDDFTYHLTSSDGRQRKFTLREKRVLTYNPKLARKQKREITKMVEKAKKLNASLAKRSEYGECGKYVTFQAISDEGEATDQKVVASLNNDAVEKDLRFAGYNLLVTSELKMSAQEVYDVYHQLWRIEETFRCLKSYLDARPVYLQNYHRIIGHFLICYLGIVLLRVLQFFVLKHELGSEQIIRLIRKMKVVRGRRNEWVNLTALSAQLELIAKTYQAPLTQYFLTTQQLNALFTKRFRPVQQVCT